MHFNLVEEERRKHYSVLEAGVSSFVVSVAVLLSAVLLLGVEAESLRSATLASDFASLFPVLSIFTEPPARTNKSH